MRPLIGRLCFPLQLSADVYVPVHRVRTMLVMVRAQPYIKTFRFTGLPERPHEYVMLMQRPCGVFAVVAPDPHADPAAPPVLVLLKHASPCMPLSLFPGFCLRINESHHFTHTAIRLPGSSFPGLALFHHSVCSIKHCILETSSAFMTVMCICFSAHSLQHFTNM